MYDIYIYTEDNYSYYVITNKYPPSNIDYLNVLGKIYSKNLQ